MSAAGIFQIILYFVLLLALVRPLGSYMAWVYQGKPGGLHRFLGPVERLIYRVGGVDLEEEMSWQKYAAVLLIFSLIGTLFLYALQRLQGFFPLNPQAFGGVSPDSSFNTAVSFVSNTNWQAYGGESTMSYLTQMAGLGVQNFLSAATGLAVLVALIRGLVRRSVQTIGNFWVDLTRSTLYILLPLSLLLAVILVTQGVVQSFSSYKPVRLLQPLVVQETVTDPRGNPMTSPDGKVLTKTVRVIEQTLPLGPAASQVAIKQLGTNGGGFFNANSAHPFENPTPLTNFLELLAILLIPAALCYTFGALVGDTRQGWALLAALMIILLPLVFACYSYEQQGNPNLTRIGIDQGRTADQPGGNMEGKETRFGIANSVLWAAVTTAASNGSVNAMHDSFTPLGGLIPLWLMQLGEVVFGGVGSGLYGLLVFAIISVFVAGLMVGRTPEYLGKKIEAYEMKMASLVILMPAFFVLIGTAAAAVLKAGTAGVANPGPHGFSELLYAFSSAANNNGSAFAGLSANTPFYNTLLGLAMFFGRFGIIIPVLAIAGSLAAKKHVPSGAGTLPTHSLLFIVMLVSIIVLVGALTFLPALALGPLAEVLLRP
jgi:K+-transporting ATPase ATPase A chain